MNFTRLAPALSALSLATFLFHDPPRCESSPPSSTTAPPMPLKTFHSLSNPPTNCLIHLHNGNVYDITSFLASHPGGIEKISLSCGKNVEEFWNLYRQHYDSPTPFAVLNKLKPIGVIPAQDRKKRIDANNPFKDDPPRSPALKQHSATPANCETPTALLTHSYCTPNDLFYVRNHHPVPVVSGDDDAVFVTVKVGGEVYRVSMEEIKRNVPSTTVTATLQCSGNRRQGMNAVKKTSGTSWYQGAISNAVWKGVKVRDLVAYVGGKVGENEKHVVFKGMDGMEASVYRKKGMADETILAYEMNGSRLPRDHGYPLRAVIPGYVGVRNVKFVQEVALSEEEAAGDWQRGINYKMLGPDVTDPKTVDLSKLPPMMEAALFSGITRAETVDEKVEGGVAFVKVEVGGWAWSGGGRNVNRVDITGDGGKTWAQTELGEGKDQEYMEAWAWTFYEGEVWVRKNEEGKFIVASKAVDVNYNVQPEKADWNVRGLNNTSWFKFEVKPE